MVQAYIAVFLIELVRLTGGLSKGTVRTGDIRLAEELMALVRSKYLVWKRVTDYATKMELSPNYLSGIIKKVSGATVGHHIRQQIVQEAKRQASGNGSSLKEVTYYLGFKDVAHFSKFFKSVSGQNFTEFRNNT